MKPLKPCMGCGGEKPRGQGVRYCAPCADTLKPMHRREAYLRRAERVRQFRAENPTGRQRPGMAPEGTKWCARCQQYLEVAEFAPSGKKLAAYCRPCGSAYRHEHSIARDFGITPEQYDHMLELQGGRCAICENRPGKRRLAVDHDHETLEIRGLLCTRCNHKLLGAAHESQAMLRRAARYLDEPPAITNQPVPDSEDGDRLELLLQSALNEAKREAKNANAAVGAAWLKRRGYAKAEQGYVVLDGTTFMGLLKEAGY